VNGLDDPGQSWAQKAHEHGIKRLTVENWLDPDIPSFSGCESRWQCSWGTRFPSCGRIEQAVPSAGTGTGAENGVA
jgi:hypothetical protein